MPNAIQKNSVAIDVVTDSVVANADAPFPDGSTREFSALKWVLGEPFEGREDTPVNLRVEAAKVATKTVRNDELITRHGLLRSSALFLGQVAP